MEIKKPSMNLKKITNWSIWLNEIAKTKKERIREEKKIMFLGEKKFKIKPETMGTIVRGANVALMIRDIVSISTLKTFLKGGRRGWCMCSAEIIRTVAYIVARKLLVAWDKVLLFYKIYVKQKDCLKE